MDLAQVPEDEIAELRRLHARLPYLRRKPFVQILAMPTVLLCMRNTVHAQRKARAEIKARVIAAPEDFQLT